MDKYNSITLKGGTEIRNLKIGGADVDILGVLRTIYNAGNDEVLDIECCYDGTHWFSLRGYKSQNTFEETGGNVPVLDGLSYDGKSYKFRVLKAGGESGSEALTISNSGGIITIDLSNSFKDRIDDIEDVLLGKVDKELKTGSQSVYKVLSDNNFTDLLLAKLSTIQIKKDASGNGKYYLVFNDGTNDVQLGVDIPLNSVIDSGSVKVCTVANEPVTGYEVGDKYIDFTIANSSEHVYILVSDLVDTMEGFDGTEIKTIVTGNTIKAELKDNSIEIARLKKIVLGTITSSDAPISEVTKYTLKEAIIVLACNIKDLYERKANKTQTIIAPVSDSDQITAGSYDITAVLQKTINNINYLFANKANINHNHEGVYIKPADVVDNLNDSSTTKPLSANQGKVLGGLINERLKGVKVDGVELTPDANKVVSIPTMVGSTASVNGKVGLVPKPLSGQQALFLKGDGTYGTPNADVVASASYIGGTPAVNTGATFENNNGNIKITLDSNYASQTAFPTAVDIVQVIRNGQTLALGADADFTINPAGGNIITLLGYTLYSDDVILVRYKTSIGIYGSIYQSSLEASIEATSDANTAAQRAEDAAIEAETIANSKIDKTAIKQELGDSETDVMSQKAVTDLANNYNVTNSIPLSAGQYYSLTTAIAAIPSALRKIGFEITFESTAGVWETYQFKGVIGDWSVLGSWSNDLSLKQDKIDNSLNTTSKDIVGAINEVKEIIDTPFIGYFPALNGIIDIKIYAEEALFVRYAVEYFWRNINGLWLIRFKGWDGTSWVSVYNWESTNYTPSANIEVIKNDSFEFTIDWRLVPDGNNFSGVAEVKKECIISNTNNSLNTQNKTVVGAINEIVGDINEVKEIIEIDKYYDVFPSYVHPYFGGILYAKIHGNLDKDVIFFVEQIESNNDYRRFWIGHADKDGENYVRVFNHIIWAETDNYDIKQRFELTSGIYKLDIIIDWSRISSIVGSYNTSNFLTSVYYPQTVMPNNNNNSGYINKDNITTTIRVDQLGAGDYTTIQAAYDSIDDSAVDNQYEIVIYPGEYNEIDLKPPTFSHTHGLAPNSVIVTSKGLGGTLPVFDQQNGSSKLSNMKIISDTGYCIHYDVGLDTETLMNENLHLIKITNGSIIGGGSFLKGTVFYWKSCIFENGDVPCHTNVNQNLENVHLIFENCKLINSYISLGSVGGYGHCVCEIKGLYTIKGNYSLKNWNSPLRNLDQPNTYLANNVEWQIIGGNNTNFFPYVNASGEALQFESKTSDSEILLEGTAVSALFGIVKYRKGSNVLKATATGLYMVRDTQAGLLPYSTPTDVYQMWKRLGDCSSVNKTLIVTIGGVSQTYTFNQDYLTSKTSESIIIADINTTITNAILQKLVNPPIWENMNTTEIQFVLAAEDIIRGEFVNANGLKCEENSLPADVYGMALESGTLGEQIRVWVGNIVNNVKYEEYIGDAEYGIGIDGGLSPTSVVKIGSTRQGLLLRY